MKDHSTGFRPLQSALLGGEGLALEMQVASRTALSHDIHKALQALRS